MNTKIFFFLIKPFILNYRIFMENVPFKIREMPAYPQPCYLSPNSKIHPTTFN